MSTEVIVQKLPKCDIHMAEGIDAEAHYDGAIRISSKWAYMCEECFSAYGVGLGTGQGQRLIVTSKGDK